jgi:hypothetical protein
MTSPNSTFFSEDFEKDLKPIQNSLMEKFRSYLGQNNIPSSIEEPTQKRNEDFLLTKEEKKKEKKQEKSSTAIKKFKKGIFDSDITLAEMLEKAPRFTSKKNEKEPKSKKIKKNNEEKIKENLNGETNKAERITCLSFKKAPAMKISKWSDEETNTFFKGIQRYGTDFSMINTIFPNKSRIQIKNKYQREIKENPLKIESNLNHPKILSKNTGGKLIELDRHINKSHELKDDSFDLYPEKMNDNQEIPEISLEDLIPLKTNSLISQDSLDKSINEQIYKIIRNETETLKQEKNIKTFF